MEHELYRWPTKRATTFGEWFTEAERVCYTLEDTIREQPGQPVEAWKIKGQTAIPAGRYRLEFVKSPKYGPDTITLVDVPGFQYIRVHSGSHIDHTEGCLLVGDVINWQAMTIHGGKIRGVLDQLKAHLKQWPENWLTIVNTDKEIPK